MAKALRHPIVVGAVLALLSGLLASLLIPALTRVWQDRPKELALKRELVERISALRPEQSTKRSSSMSPPGTWASRSHRQMRVGWV
jgi:hypothetical protein